MYYLLFYDYVPDYMERRGEFREAHFRHARASLERGELTLGGAFADPPDGAVIVFQGESRAVAEDFAAADPYVESGLVREWRVREWTVVIGGDTPGTP